MSELISVVIPIYNVEKYLLRCVMSILNQTYREIEVILVNDGSTDKCGSICDDIESRDSRVRVIHKTNGGLSDARNVGIKNAKGKYLTFLDSDDWVNEMFLEKLHRLLLEKNAEISVCNYMKTAEENTEITTNEDIEVIEFTNIEALEQLYGIFSPQLFVAWGKLYKASLFNDITYPYGRIHEDDFTTYKVLYKAKKTVLTTEKLLCYWQRSDSIMGVGFKPKHVLDLLDAYEERAVFLHENNLTDLLAKTYKSIFYIYIRIYLELYRFLPVISKEEFVDRFTDFKFQLKGSKQSNSFKLTYELFSSFPIFFKAVYKLIHLLKVDRLLMEIH